MTVDTERIGLSLGLLDDTALVERAEELGYDSIWTGEGQGQSAFGKLERWAAHTSAITLGASIVNVFSRTPAALAQSVATLDAHSEGRAVLGLGVAHPGVVEGFHGTPYDRPLPRMAEYITLVRRYLAGVAEPFDGEFFAPERTSFWDAFEPVRREVPIYNAALGPANVRLTGQYADGWIPYLYPPEQFAAAQEWLEAGAKQGDRDVEDIDVAMYLLTSIADDHETALAAAADHVVQYFRSIPGYYERVARDAGYGEAVDAAQAAASDAEAAASLPDELVASMGLVGTESSVRTQLRELRDAGLDLPIVRVPMSADEEALRRTMEALAPRGT